ncbi:MAG: hypothetical protein CMM93_02580 [Rickettsiales bacterium]|nr:hypothetical protein [Rickettsiales bacterium]
MCAQLKDGLRACDAPDYLRNMPVVLATCGIDASTYLGTCQRIRNWITVQEDPLPFEERDTPIGMMLLPKRDLPEKAFLDIKKAVSVLIELGPTTFQEQTPNAAAQSKSNSPWAR